MILHLLPESTWRRVRGGDADQYWPDTFAAEGFVHCSPDDDVMLTVANRYYADGTEGLVVLDLDESELTSEVRWEAPDPAPPPGVAADVLFPHVYGPLDLAAVVRVRRLVVGPGGGFEGYEPID